VTTLQELKATYKYTMYTRKCTGNGTCIQHCALKLCYALVQVTHIIGLMIFVYTIFHMRKRKGLAFRRTTESLSAFHIHVQGDRSYSMYISYESKREKVIVIMQRHDLRRESEFFLKTSYWIEIIALLRTA
jgi:hypothetical protein